MVRDPRSPGTSRTMIEQILATHTTTPTLWWLGHSGFAVKFSNILFLVDPVLSELDGRTRIIPAPFPPQHMTGADLVLCTHAHSAHMDPATLRPLLDASPRAKLVLPKSAAEIARAAGIPYDR